MNPTILHSYSYEAGKKLIGGTPLFAELERRIKNGEIILIEGEARC